MEFLNPWYMVWGGALISSPIIIHLINRMRFKRIRWAAMEFLLKSQKRNRRRLIIEQMILLLLRILLVLLAGFLVARLLGNVVGKPEEGATHVIVIDDSLSMRDHGHEKNQDRTAFARARDQVQLLTQTLNKATTPQRLQVKLLSDLEHDLFPLQPVSDTSMMELEKVLRNIKPTFLRLTPEEAFTAAETALAKVAHGQKIFHFASDFREPDWTEPVQKQVEQMVKNGMFVSFIDVAGPFRNRDQKAVQNHDNVAILDVRCETRVVPVGVDAEFTVTIKNYSLSEVEPFLTVKVDGVEDYRGIGPVGRIPGGQTMNKTFRLSFAKKKEGPKIETKDPLEERERKRRQDRDFYRVSVQLDSERGGTGIRADNARDMVIEVRREVPMLVVEGNPAEIREDGSDVAILESAIASARGFFKAAEAYTVQRCKVADLDHVDLALYPTVFLLNVAEIKSKKALDRLDDYVSGGGSLVYFMGPNVRTDFYNNTLYRDHNKLFPVLLDRVTSLADPTGGLNAEERKQARQDRLQNDLQPKILFRKGDHPVVQTLYPIRTYLSQLDLDSYIRTQPRSQWESEDDNVEEIVTLPNSRDKSKSGYGGTAQNYGRQALAQAKLIAENEPEFKVYVDFLQDYQRDIATAGATSYIFDLVQVLDRMLNDQGEKGNDKRPNMTNLWAHPKMRGLAQQIKDFIETMTYGDPLVVARRHGPADSGGRVVAFLTSAGLASGWNRWCYGTVASGTFAAFIIDLERWLLSGGNQSNRTVGTPFEIELEAGRYQPRLRWSYQPQDDMEQLTKDGKPTAMKATDMAEENMRQEKSTLRFTLPVKNRPGVLTVELLPAGIAGEQVIPETHAVAYNIDTQESEMKRVNRDKLLQAAGGKDNDKAAVVVRSPEDSFETYKDKEPDVSESSWLYLLFLVILVVEQALAVHLSFHLKGSEAAPATPAPQPAREPASAA